MSHYFKKHEKTLKARRRAKAKRKANTSISRTKPAGTQPEFKPMPELGLLDEHFEYNPETGKIIYKQHVHKHRIGQTAGTVTKKGYVQIGFQGHTLMGHRLAWYLATGIDPIHCEIDHKNRIKSDNRLCNLRNATRAQQMGNRNIRGFKSRYRSDQGDQTGTHTVSFTHRYKQRSFGAWMCPLMARAVYEEASDKLRGEYSAFGGDGSLLEVFAKLNEIDAEMRKVRDQKGYRKTRSTGDPYYSSTLKRKGAFFRFHSKDIALMKARVDETRKRWLIQLQKKSEKLLAELLGPSRLEQAEG